MEVIKKLKNELEKEAEKRRLHAGLNRHQRREIEAEDRRAKRRKRHRVLAEEAV